MKNLIVCRNELSLLPDSSRVIIRPFIPGDPRIVASVLERALALSEEKVTAELGVLRADFNSRHFDIENLLLHHYRKIQSAIVSGRPISHNRQLLIGAMFSGEYALESAALFNPSIVPASRSIRRASGLPALRHEPARHGRGSHLLH